MSHQPQRKEKDCLNCGTIVYGPYCHICGQENIVTRQNFISLTKHFIYDIFHFDGKFFDTLKYLLTRPGFIPKRFIEGKRQSFLDPIRMYLFTSAIFFLVFFAVKDPMEAISNTDTEFTLSKNDRLVLASQLYANQKDSAQLKLVLDTTISLRVYPVKDSVMVDSSAVIAWKGRSYLMDTLHLNIEDADSSTTWLGRAINRKWQAYRNEFGDDSRAMFADFSNSFLHKLPYVLFVSLPFFALILKLLYSRRKKMLFSEHSIFTLYHFIFSFILLLIYFLLEALQRWTGWGVFNLISVLVLLSGGIYLFISMRKFYGQSGGKTFVKFLLLNILGFTSLMLIMFTFLLFSVFQF